MQSKKANKMQKTLDQDSLIKKIPKNKNKKITLYFSHFSKIISNIVGSAYTFVFALFCVLIWGFSGHYFHYSDTWQLIINTSTTIITFLVVFLIQNTQNRDTAILNLKIDELIKSQKHACNDVIDLTQLTDEEIKLLELEYKKLKGKTTGK